MRIHHFYVLIHVPYIYYCYSQGAHEMESFDLARSKGHFDAGGRVEKSEHHTLW